MKDHVNFENIEDAMSYLNILGKPIPELPPLSLYHPKPKDPVVGGDPIRVPIDRVAARVVAKAPDHFKPPPEPAKNIMNDPKPVITSERQRNRENMDQIHNQMSQSPDGGASNLVMRKKEADFDIELAAAGTKKFTQNVQQTEDLVKRAEESRAAIDYLVTHVQKAWCDYDDFITKALVKARATKVAIEIETKQTLATLADVRKFFLDPRHEEEIQRLKEFVQICERLRELKRDGFLDAVTDTILRLEMGGEQ